MGLARATSSGLVAGLSGAVADGDPDLTVGLVTFTNTAASASASASTGFVRFGLAFEVGKVPAGNVLKGFVGSTEVRLAVMGTNTWANGSLRKATVVADVGAVPANGSVTLDVQRRGAPAQGSSGLDPFAYLTSNTDFRVEVTNHSGSASGTLPDRTYSLNTALATTTRREILDDTPLCVRAFAWGHPAGEKHLMCLHYVDLWLDAGTVGVEWTPVLSQHWWIDDPFGDGAQTKERREFDVEALDATASLSARTDTGLTYNTRLAMLRLENDAQHAKPLWIDKGSAMPTLALSYSLDTLKQMMRAKYLPPSAQGITYDTSGLANTYIPGGEQTGTVRHNHRRGINGQGGYNARGEVGSMDIMALSTQTPELWRIARVSAQAGGLAPFFFADHRNLATGKLTAMPFPVEQIGAQSYPGLGDEVVAAVLTGNFGYDAPNNSNNTKNLGLTSWDSAHHHNYSFMMAFIEGDAHLQDYVFHAFDAGIRRNSYSTFGIRPQLEFATVAARRTALGIPTSTTYGVTPYDIAQERSYGLGMLSVARWLQLMPDDDPHAPYVRNLLDHGDRHIKDSYAFFPNDHRRQGGWRPRFSRFGTAFMNCFNVTGGYLLDSIADDLGFDGYRLFADQCARLLAQSARNPHRPFVTRDMRYSDNDRLVHLPVDVFPQHRRFVSSGNQITRTTSTTIPILDGDIIVASDDNDQGVAIALPSPLVAGTAYYVVNSANTPGGPFQLSATPGGTPLTVADQASWFAGIDQAAFGTEPISSAGIINPDSTQQIVNATIERMWASGSVELSEAQYQAWQSFYAARAANWPGEAFASWNLDGDLVRSNFAALSHSPYVPAGLQLAFNDEFQTLSVEDGDIPTSGANWNDKFLQFGTRHLAGNNDIGIKGFPGYAGSGGPTLAQHGLPTMEINADGNLLMQGWEIPTALRPQFFNFPYVAPHIDSRRTCNFDYGYIEYRFRAIDLGGGSHWSLWLWTSDDNVNHMEIDAVEIIGSNSSSPDGPIPILFLNSHDNRPGANHSATYPQDFINVTVAELFDWHTYGVEITPSVINWTIDGVQRRTIPNIYPANQPWHIFVTLEMGASPNGDFPGPVRPGTPFPNRAELDYIRVYTADGSLVPPPPFP